MAIEKQKIAIVGCGPGPLEYLAPIARKAIEEAEVLVGAARLLALFPESKAERIAVSADIAGALSEIESRISSKKVAVLVTGDPGLCSFARPVIKRFGRDACYIIPGISSVQLAFARVGLDWYDARIISLHAKDAAAESENLHGVSKIAILAGRDGAMNWIAEFARNLSGDRIAIVCENLAMANEKIREMDPNEIESLQVASLTIVLLIERNLLQ